MDKCKRCQDLDQELEQAAATYWNAYHRYNGLSDRDPDKARAAQVVEAAKRRLDESRQDHELHLRTDHTSQSGDSEWTTDTLCRVLPITGVEFKTFAYGAWRAQLRTEPAPPVFGDQVACQVEFWQLEPRQGWSGPGVRRLTLFLSCSKLMGSDSGIYRQKIFFRCDDWLNSPEVEAQVALLRE